MPTPKYIMFSQYKCTVGKIFLKQSRNFGKKLNTAD